MKIVCENRKEAVKKVLELCGGDMLFNNKYDGIGGADGSIIWRIGYEDRYTAVSTSLYVQEYSDHFAIRREWQKKEIKNIWFKN